MTWPGTGDPYSIDPQPATTQDIIHSHTQPRSHAATHTRTVEMSRSVDLITHKTRLMTDSVAVTAIAAAATTHAPVGQSSLYIHQMLIMMLLERHA